MTILRGNAVAVGVARCGVRCMFLFDQNLQVPLRADNFASPTFLQPCARRQPHWRSYNADTTPSSTAESQQKAKIFQRTIDCEHQQQMYSHIQSQVCANEASGLTLINVPLSPTHPLLSPSEVLATTPPPTLYGKRLLTAQPLRLRLSNLTSHLFEQRPIHSAAMVLFMMNSSSQVYHQPPTIYLLARSLTSGKLSSPPLQSLTM